MTIDNTLLQSAYFPKSSFALPFKVFSTKKARLIANIQCNAEIRTCLVFERFGFGPLSDNIQQTEHPKSTSLDHFGLRGYKKYFIYKMVQASRNRLDCGLRGCMCISGNWDKLAFKFWCFPIFGRSVFGISTQQHNFIPQKGVRLLFLHEVEIQILLL